MTFPTPYTVKHSVFNGTGQDSRGNDASSWSTPSDVKVIGWAPAWVESTDGHSSRVVADIDLLIPPTLAVSVRDRFTLPAEGACEVVAVEDCNHGFHQWTPGSVVKLKRVTG